MIHKENLFVGDLPACDRRSGDNSLDACYRHSCGNNLGHMDPCTDPSVGILVCSSSALDKASVLLESWLGTELEMELDKVYL